MASSSILSPYTEMSLCLVCKGTLIDPRLLPCFHTFCFNCIINNTTPLQSDSSQNLNTLQISCPKCREDYRYQAEAISEMLPKDTFAGQLCELLRIKEQFLFNTNNNINNSSNNNNIINNNNNNSNNNNNNIKKQESSISRKSQKSTKDLNLIESTISKTPKCEDCSQDHAPLSTFYCINCRICLCKADAKAHQKVHNSTHRLLSKDDLCEQSLEELMSQDWKTPCKLHQHLNAEFFCSFCQVCRGFHKTDHEIVHIEDQVKSIQEELETNLGESSDKIQNFKSTIQRLSQMEMGMKDNVENIKKDVIAKFDSIIDTIKQRKKQILMQLEELIDKESYPIQLMKTRLESRLDNLYELTKKSEFYLCNTLHMRFLLDIKYQLMERMHSLLATADPIENELFLEVPKINLAFDDQLKHSLKHIGKIQIERIDRLKPSNFIKYQKIANNLSTENNCQLISFTCSKNNQFAYLFDQTNQELNKIDNKGDIIAKFSLDIPHATYSNDITTITTNNNNNSNSNNNNNNNNIDLIKLDKLYTHINKAKLYVSLTSCNKILIFDDVTGQFLYSIIDNLSSPSGLCVNKSGDVIIADRGNNLVKIFNSDNIHQLSLSGSSFGSENFSPIDVSNTPSNTFCVLSISDPCIAMFTFNGQLLTRFGFSYELQGIRIMYGQISVMVSCQNVLLIERGRNLVVCYDQDKITLYKREIEITQDGRYPAGNNILHYELVAIDEKCNLLLHNRSDRLIAITNCL